ncbi:MAG TPA: hypothetical protein VF519_02110 [Mycobacteriales bacterium]|jgi:hypothetical protein
MNQLVLHHTYIGGSAADVSGFGHHGRSTGAVPAAAPNEGAYVFSRDRGMLVAASPELARMSAFRVRMRFCVTQDVPGWRHNLMEAHAVFVLAVMPGLGLHGGILCADGVWRGVTTANGSVVVNRWQTAELSFDGVNRLEVAVDGVRVAATVSGPVRGAGPLGIGIGRWPDDPRYGLHGMIGETKLWRYDPYSAFAALVDRCCEPDLDAVAAVAEKVRASGMTPDRLRTLVRDRQDATFALLRAARSGGGTRELDSVVPQLVLAMTGRDRSEVPRWRDRLRSLLTARAGTTRMAAYDAESAALLASMGLTDADTRRLLTAMCLGDLAPAGPDEPEWPDGAERREGGGDAPWNDTGWVPHGRDDDA